MLILPHLSAFSGGRKAGSMWGRGSHSGRALRSFPEVIGFMAISHLLLRVANQSIHPLRKPIHADALHEAHAMAAA
jgi:hypothetical protein